MIHNHDPVIKKMNYRFLSSLLVISFIIGVVDGLVMLLLNLSQQEGGLFTEFQETIMNTLLLELISAPLLWFLVLKPLLCKLIENRRQFWNTVD